MSFFASCISVGGIDLPTLLDRLDLVETDQTMCLEEEWFHGRMTGGVAKLPAGRVLFVSQFGNLATPKIAVQVSEGAELVMCTFDERVMVRTISSMSR